MPSTTVNVHVPGNHLMTGLLGQRDELLLLIEDAFPEADVHVRGNEITVSGDQAGTVGKLFEELVVPAFLSSLPDGRYALVAILDNPKKS